MEVQITTKVRCEMKQHIVQIDDDDDDDDDDDNLPPTTAIVVFADTS